jgi:hypothetical protein
VEDLFAKNILMTPAFEKKPIEEAREKALNRSLDSGGIIWTAIITQTERPMRQSQSLGTMYSSA